MKTISKNEAFFLLIKQSPISNLHFTHLKTQILDDNCVFVKEHVLTFQCGNQYFQTHILEDRFGKLSFDHDLWGTSLVSCFEAIKIKNNLYVNKDIFSNSEAA